MTRRTGLSVLLARPGLILVRGSNGLAVFFVLACALATLPSPHAMSAQEKPATVTIQGTTRNGTSGQATAVDRLELMRVGEANMESLEVIEHPPSSFRFRPVERGGAVLLVRATFGNDNFVQVVPPPEKPESGATTTPVTLTVFERGATMRDMEFRSGLQISRLKDGLDISLVYAATNRSNPPRSFYQEGLLLPVPARARNLRVSVSHQSSGMPVTIETTPAEGGVRFSHALRPGTSELSLHFRLDGHVFRDRKDFTAETFTQPGGQDSPFFRVLIWRPLDARPDVEGAKVQPFDIPKLGQALQVTYTDESVIYRFDRGSVWYENPMEAHSNPIFDEPWKSAAGLGLGLTLVLLILSIVAGARKRPARKPEA